MVICVECVSSIAKQALETSHGGNVAWQTHFLPHYARHESSISNNVGNDAESAVHKSS